MRRVTTEQKPALLSQDVEVVPVDVPLGGWDAISPLSKMEPKYAVTLRNWVPRTGWMELRQGYQAWCQGLSGAAVDTLAAYRPAGAAEQLFAITAGKVWDVSTEGLPVPQPIGPFSNSRWQTIMFTPPQGSNYLVMVNGADACFAYANGVWSQPVITGVNTALLSNIATHAKRIWFTEKNSTRAWYLPVGGIQGAANVLDLGSLWNMGGFISGIGTWTIDGGLGPDDYCAFMSSRGQFALYKGTDPSNASAWSLVGIFDLPPPIGNRSLARMGADLWVITHEGVLPLSQALPFNPAADRSVAMTQRIQNAMLKASTSYRDNFGWELRSYSAEGLTLLNIPVQENVQQSQFVTNMLTGAWCEFEGWNFNTFEIFNERLYAGDNNGNVVLAYKGVADLASPILGVMECAFNYFGDSGRLKRITMVQPMLVTSGAIVPSIAIATDFASAGVAAPAIASLAASGALWDSSYWDSAYYGAGDSSVLQWITANGYGHAIAIQMAVNVAPAGPGGTSILDTGVFDTAVFDGYTGQTQTLQLNAFNVMLEKGAVV